MAVRRLSLQPLAFAAAVSVGFLVGRTAQAGTTEFDCTGFGFHGPHGGAVTEGACAGVGHLVFLGAVALIVVVGLRLRHATTRRRLDLARRMIEQGMAPAPELIAPAGNDLRRGLVLVATGAGLMAYTAFGHGSSMIGLVPAFIGGGYLLSHRFASGPGST